MAGGRGPRPGLGIPGLAPSGRADRRSASNAGATTDPAWFHNLRAHPEVILAGVAMRASTVEDEDERRRLWDLGDRVFPAFASDRADARRHGRRIPIVQLRPRPGEGVRS